MIKGILDDVFFGVGLSRFGQAADLQAWRSEVQQQAVLQALGFQEVQALRGVCRAEGADGFQFHHNRFVDDQIGDVGADDLAFEPDVNRLLLIDGKTVFPQCVSPSYSPHSRDSLAGMVQASGIA